MNDFHYPFICALNLLLLLLIAIQYIKSTVDYKKNNYFLIYIGSSILYCIIDFVWELITNSYLPAKHLFFTSTLNITVGAFTNYAFALFIFSFLEKKTYRGLFTFLLSIPALCVAGFIIWNCFTKKVFYVNEFFEYIRGECFYVYPIFAFYICYYIFSLCVSVYSYFKKKHENIRLSRTMIFFSIIPLISGILQGTKPYAPFLSIGNTLCCFIIFTFQLTKEHETIIKTSIQNQLKEILDKCISLLYKNEQPQENINMLLEVLADYYGAENVLLAEVAEEKIKLSVTYSWSRKPTPFVMAEKLATLPENVVLDWYKVFNTLGEVYIETSAGSKQFSDFVYYCKKNKIKNSFSVPIYAEEKIVAIISIYNFEKFKNNFTVAKTMGFFLLSEINKRKFLDDKQKANDNIIKALAFEYSCIYYINLDEDTFSICREDGLVQKKIPSVYKNKLPYTNSFEHYNRQFVAAEDQEEMSTFGVVEVLKELLAHRKSVSKKFRSAITGEINNFEAKWVKVESENSEAHFVVLGLANIEKKIKQEQEDQKERQRAKEKLNTIIQKAKEAKRESQLDKLTGLYNKVSGTEIIKEYLAKKDEQELFALLFIDLDKFKKINDTFGHLEGDKILEGVGKAIRKKCRSCDIAVRFGGDEFVIMIKSIPSLNLVQEKATSIANEVARLSYGKEYKVTCSIGGVMSTTNNFDSIIQSADKALYQVKDKGRDGIFITDKN